jgi:hypothetical protein
VLRDFNFLIKPKTNNPEEQNNKICWSSKHKNKKKLLKQNAVRNAI